MFARLSKPTAPAPSLHIFTRKTIGFAKNHLYLKYVPKMSKNDVVFEEEMMDNFQEIIILNLFTHIF